MTSSSQPLQPTEIDAIEATVDETFAAAELPTGDRFNSRWAVTRTYEDQLRFELARTAQRASEPSNYRQAVSAFIAKVDGYKYDLRAAMNAIDERQPAVLVKRARDSETGEIYTRAGQFGLVSAGAYASASRVFGPVRAGTRTLLRTSDGKLRVSEEPAEYGYAALEALHGADDPGFSPIPFLVDIFRGPTSFDKRRREHVSWPEFVATIVQRTNVRREVIRYQFITTVAREALQVFRLDRPDIPNGWMFPCGDLDIVSDVFRGLATRAFYHLLAVNFGAQRLGLRGGGVDQLCLEIDRTTLTADLCRLLGRSEAEVKSVLTYLTYGESVRTPDPALQPIIPVGGDRILLPPFLILTSNWGRNLLTLHARTDPASFNAQSHAFEQLMVQRLQEGLRSDWIAWPNRNLPAGKSSEEVDLVLVEKATHTILLCEARWMIQPGDIREVLQRKNVCREKVAQALRKREAVRANIKRVAASLGLDPTANWTVEALVVIDNFGGTPSPVEGVPIVHRKIFAEAALSAPSLARLHPALASSAWLPRAGSDYKRVYDTVDIGGVEIELPGFRMGPRSYLKEHLPKYLAEAWA